MILDRASFTPLYHQLFQNLRQNIESGVWPAHSPTPSERELCEMCQVSRGTVRQALAQLVYQGLVYRKPGKGTFVTGLKLTLQKFDTFAKDIQRKGMIVSFRLLLNKKIVPNSHIRTFFQLTEKEMIFKIARLLLGDGEPFVLATTYIPEKVLPGLDKEDLKHIALSDIFVKKLRVPMIRAKETLGSIPLDSFEAEKLRVPRDLPALLVKRIVYTAKAPIILEEHVVRGDKCNYSFEYSYEDMRFSPSRYFIVERSDHELPSSNRILLLSEKRKMKMESG
jgi:GntR family transcriptional regulator